MDRNPSATCATCDYWQGIKDNIGQCRLEPPKLFLLPSQRPVNVLEALKAGDVKMEPGFTLQPQVPMTQGDFWCGEHSDFYPEGAYAGDDVPDS